MYNFKDHLIFSNNIWDSAYILKKKLHEEGSPTLPQSNTPPQSTPPQPPGPQGIVPGHSKGINRAVDRGLEGLNDAFWWLMDYVPDPSSPWIGSEEIGGPFGTQSTSPNDITNPPQGDPSNPAHHPQGPYYPPVNNPSEWPPHTGPNGEQLPGQPGDHWFRDPDNPDRWFFLPGGGFQYWWTMIPENTPSRYPGLPGGIPGAPYYPGTYQS